MKPSRWMDVNTHTHTHTHKTWTKIKTIGRSTIKSIEIYNNNTRLARRHIGETRCFICRWMVRQSCCFVQNLVVNYYLMISYTQQCHIVIIANHHCDRITGNLAFYIFSTAKNPRNFTWISGVEILWKDTVSAKFQKLCGNCAFPQNFHTRKLGEITWFFAVLVWKFE